MVGSNEQFKFGQDKYDTLPKYCLECPVLFACNGECPKNRFIETPDGKPGLNYLCAGYKAFFQRIDEPMKLLAMLISTGREASDLMGILAERKDVLERDYKNTKPDQLCPCGSHMSYKECHGWVRSKRGRRRRGLPTGGPRPPVRVSMNE